jgi:cytochrome c peroxidase
MPKKFLLVPLVLCLTAVVILAFTIPAEAQKTPLTPKEQLGKMLFLDKSLSINNNQSCATCHAAEFGYVGPNAKVNEFGSVYPGSIKTAFGDRKPPSSAYAGESPPLHYDDAHESWVGGMFWDGRATGWVLGDPLAEQAKGPYLNPVEQALPDAQALCQKVAKSSYARLFERVWGAGSLNCDTPEGYEAVYDQIGFSVAAYERSVEVNPFNSRFDSFWDKAHASGLDVGEITLANWQDYQRLGLTNQELYGLALFNDEDSAYCEECHNMDPGEAGYPLFTDFTYDNVGVPRNPDNPVYMTNPSFVDPGLGGFLQSAGYDASVYEAEWGKFRVPTVRNVDKREGSSLKAFGHNGYFKSLEEIVHFYNTRDVKDWPAPEFAGNLNTADLGDLGLSPADEAALVAFMKTLTDKTSP